MNASGVYQTPRRTCTDRRSGRRHLAAVLLLGAHCLLATGATAQSGAAELSPFARGKAEALLRVRLSCLGCHRIGEDGGRIGPELTTVGARRNREYIAAMVADPQRVVPGTLMPRTPMPESMRTLVVGYLASRGATAGGPPPKSEGSVERANLSHPSAAPPINSPQTAPAGELEASGLYARHCAACHGATGAGDGPNAQFLPVKPAVHASREAMALRPDDTLFDTIAAGGWVLDKNPRMPAFGETLTRQQIHALVRHIRRLCQCEGPAWSRDGARTERPR